MFISKQCAEVAVIQSSSSRICEATEGKSITFRDSTVSNAFVR